MVRKSILCWLCLIALAVFGAEVFARGGRGGGGGGGRGGGGFSGGGSRGGGGFSGGARPSGGGGYRPSPSASRSPSMSRPSSAPRPSQASRPSPATRPSSGVAGQRPGSGAAGQRPGSGAAGQRPGSGIASQRPGGAGAGSGALSGKAALNSPSSFNRPSQGQLNNFLNMPKDAGGAARSGAGQQLGASQLPSGDGTRSFTTDRGTTITVGGQGGTAQVGGGTVGAGIGGIKVETAGGATFGKVGGGVGVAGEGGAAVRGGSISGAQTSRGSIANVSRGYADTAGNRAGGSATVAQNRAGYTAANVRAGYSSGGVTQLGSVGAIRGPGGNVVSGGRGASFVNGQFVGGHSWGAVNGAYTHWNCFNGAWAGHYPGCWWPGKWAVAATAWAVATWPYASAYSGCSGDPYYYDYGSNVAYDEGTVYADEQPVATAEEYYNQAEQIADTGAEATNEDWLPLGVFAVIAEEGQTKTDKVVQLAINRDGIIRGNFQDLLTDKVTPVTGAVDKKTQRVSLKIEGNDELVVDTGLYNLTNDEAPVLVHFNANRREGRVFIRLKQPEGAQQPQQPQAQPTNPAGN